MNLSKVTRNCIYLKAIMRNVKNRWGRTQLQHCVEKELTSGVKRLLSIRNINVNVKDVNGWTPLHYAAINGHIEIAGLLLQNGAEVNAKDKNGKTPLHWAAYRGHFDILHLLVENGADLEAQSNYGERALHVAAWMGDLPFIQELISRYHVDINARRNDESTALTLARVENHYTIATFLESTGGIV
jgi:ankyrin repeat protein